MAANLHNDLFSSVIAEIKSYTGKDPLLPWLRGVRNIRDSLPTHVLNEKLPRFLQKCAQTFESDRRYRNDLRYLRIWLQLMDYVDDPKALLRTMEAKKIGIKRSLFYQAYALYYEKLKKFEEADKMYHLGIQNLAEPQGELQKSYEQFIQRMERQKYKRIQRQERKIAKRPLSDRSTDQHSCTSKENNENYCKLDQSSEGSLLKESSSVKESEDALNESKNILAERSQNLAPLKEAKAGEKNKLYRDDSVVVKFVDSAIVGRSEAEDACHHGLVEPTINMKEAMDAINSMFSEPIEPAHAVRRSHRGQPKADQSISNGFEVFIDENSDSMVRSSCPKDAEVFIAPQPKPQQPPQEPLKIFVDDDSSNDSEATEVQTSADGSPSSSSRVDGFVFLRPNDHHSGSSNDIKTEKSSRPKFREDTVVRRFVGSAILDEPDVVENICHHGLVDPTINLKEAMEDINGMFGKPIDFVRTTRRKRQEREAASGKNDYGAFSILPDDDINTQEAQKPPQSSSNKENHDLFEPTVFTKEAMDDINDLFRMPLDF